MLNRFALKSAVLQIHHLKLIGVSSENLLNRIRFQEINELAGREALQKSVETLNEHRIVLFGS